MLATDRRQRGATAHGVGVSAEHRAADALRRDGWSMLGQRVRTAAGEIDLIVQRDDVLAFVEVKARPSLAEAAWALGPRQRQRLLAAADAWLALNPCYGTAGVRFDVVLVAADGSTRRIADAFRLGDE